MSSYVMKGCPTCAESAIRSNLADLSSSCSSDIVNLLKYYSSEMITRKNHRGTPQAPATFLTLPDDLLSRIFEAAGQQERLSS